MKKTILILIVVFTAFLSSCNKDEDTPTPTPDAFIGSWKLNDYIEGTTSYITDCEKNTTLVVTADFNGVFNYYDVNSNGDCVLQEVENFTWENLNNNYYKLTSTLDGTVVIETLLVIFEDNQLILDYEDDEKYIYIKN